MTLKEYLLDRVYLIVFYLLLMTFVTVLVYLDPAVKVWTDNIIYMNIVAMFAFLIYLSGSYIARNRNYENINQIIRDGKEDLIYSLPETHNYEQKLFKQLLINMYDQQNARLEKIYAEKKDDFEFISSWIHEIKTPIAVSNLLIQNSRGKENEELLNSLEEEIDRIERMVEQVLYYSKSGDFSRDYFISDVDIKALVHEVLKKHAKIFIYKNIRIEIGSTDIEVSSDKKWLLFILDQLISNSLKYTDQGGLISIYTERDEREKRLIITDNGIGIKAEDLDRVFDRGFTGYNGREFTKSTGMGLYLTKKLVRKLGHEVTIDSVFGEYTRVIIHFPKIGEYYSVT